MVDKIFFQSSMPRAGSTLLQNILNQDPRIYASATSGLLELVNGVRNIYTSAEEFRAQDQPTMRAGMLGFCGSGIKGFYNAITEKPYVIDKSRGHMANFDFIASFNPNPKMICMVRNLPDIFASFETLFRNNHHRSSPIIDNINLQGTTTPKRVDLWASSPPLGLALDRLSEVIRQGIDKKMLFIKYESLCLYPENEMKRIYEFLELSPFTSNFDFIPQTTFEDDEVYGITGLHTIRPKLEMQQSKAISVLGQDVYNWIMSNFMWYHEYFGYRN